MKHVWKLEKCHVWYWKRMGKGEEVKRTAGETVWRGVNAIGAWLECSGRWRKRLIHLIMEGELSNRDKKRGNTNTWTLDGHAGQRKRQRESEGGAHISDCFRMQRTSGVGASGAQMLIADLQLHPRLRRCCGWSCRARCPRHLGNQEIKKFWFMPMAQYTVNRSGDQGSGGYRRATN